MTEETPLLEPDLNFYPSEEDFNIANTSFRLVSTITKQPDEEWYIWFKADRMLTTKTPDPRDCNIQIEPEKDYSFARDWYKLYRYPNGGLMGVDREYIGENEIKVTYYFNSKQYAKYFFYNFNRSKQQGRAKENHKLFLNNLKTAYEIPNYGRNWNLYDPDGKDISEYIK